VVATCLPERGVEARAHQARGDAGMTFAELVADTGEEQPFCYQIRPREVPMPVYGGRVVPKGTDTYCQLEVHLRDGGQGYDVMGYTRGQLADDVLDQYERPPRVRPDARCGRLRTSAGVR
jgi:choline/glycine/proline betaine transport protein